MLQGFGIGVQAAGVFGGPAEVLGRLNFLSGRGQVACDLRRQGT
jgi:hypothetical protein